MNEKELKNKYSAFITEISEILGLGKPVDILKLCATTDLFFQPLEKRIEELEIANKNISDECHKLVDSLEKKQNENKELTDKVKELETQIEKMKSALIDIKSNTDDVNIEWQIKYLFDELEIKEND